MESKRGLNQLIVLIRGAGEMASGVAHRLYRSHFRICMIEIPSPLAVRRGVSFCEAAKVFRDSASFTWFDPHHSRDEERYLTMGLSRYGNVLVVAHTERGERIRIISARKATRRETEFYEEDR